MKRRMLAWIGRVLARLGRVLMWSGGVIALLLMLLTVRSFWRHHEWSIERARTRWGYSSAPYPERTHLSAMAGIDHGLLRIDFEYYPDADIDEELAEYLERTGFSPPRDVVEVELRVLEYSSPQDSPLWSTWNAEALWLMRDWDDWSVAGIGTAPGDSVSGARGGSMMFPLPLAALLCAYPAIRVAILSWRARRRQRRNQCSKCGYDLRSGDGLLEKCPECGAIARAPSG